LSIEHPASDARLRIDFGEANVETVRSERDSFRALRAARSEEFLAELFAKGSPTATPCGPKERKRSFVITRELRSLERQ